MSTIEGQIPNLVPNTQIGGDALGLVKNGGNVVIGTDGTMSTETSEWVIFNDNITTLLDSNKRLTHDVMMEVYCTAKISNVYKAMITASNVQFTTTGIETTIAMSKICGYKGEYNPSSRFVVLDDTGTTYIDFRINSSTSIFIFSNSFTVTGNSATFDSGQATYTNLLTRIYDENDLQNNQYRIKIRN